MKLRSTRLTGVALLAAASLALTACGDDGGSTGSEEPPTDSESSAPPEAGDGDGTLTVGSLLPQTGSLSSLGPPEFAGVELAVQEINEAGGVLDADVEYIEGDSGDTSQDIANPTVDRLLAADVDVIIGAASSDVSKNVIDKIVNAGVIQYSPANTSPDFTTIEDDGLYFRTAPSDVLQGRILGETILADGNTSVGVISQQSEYGEGLAVNLISAVEASGGTVSPGEPVFYDPNTSNFDAQVGEIQAANPDAIVVIGFAESATVVQALESAGIGQGDKQIYFVDGNLGSAELAALPPGTLTGARGSLPGAEAPGEFRERLVEISPGLDNFSYAAESYDAVITTALAAVAAGTDDPVQVAENLPDVTREGEKCTTFVECVELLEADTDIDYDGLSGPIEFSDQGDPTEASVGIYTYDAQNELEDAVDFQSGTLEQ